MSDADPKPIGGYFELELPPAQSHYHNGLKLNSGRSCLAQILLHSNTRKLYIPYYICDSVIEPLVRHKIDFEYYRINDSFEITEAIDLSNHEMLLYVNYFGLKTEYTSKLSNIYTSSLIIDNTQNFFDLPNTKSPTFYSPRKFFGIPDGGYLCSIDPIDTHAEKAKSHNNCTHLLGRIENDPENNYHAYQKNEESLSYKHVLRMSSISDRILYSIDYIRAKTQRESNFVHLHKSLAKYNKLNIKISDASGPMCYPFLTEEEDLRDKLIANKIFVPRYWEEVLAHKLEYTSPEFKFTRNLLPLPIDQRYSCADMDRIINCIQS